MNPNYRGILVILLVAFALCAALFFLSPQARAEENATVNITANGSTVTVEYEPHIIYPPHPIYRIQQGDEVWVNDTIDVSGMGWGSGFAWYGRYGEYTDAVYVRYFKNYRSDLMRFYLDPEIFSGRTGMWYQYYGNATERQGNLEAFYVREGYRNSTLTFSNGTVINQSVGVSNTTGMKEVKPEILPEKHVADYLLARGDPLTVYPGGSAKMWIFGQQDKMYDVPVDDGTVIPAIKLEGFKEGTYTLLIQKPGRNTIYEVSYENNSLVSPWAKVKPVDLNGILPFTALPRLTTMLATTDDTYEMYTIEIQQPAITIVRFDEVGVGARPFDYAFQSGLVTFMDVRGYTNMVSGSKMTAVLDGGNTYTRYSDAAFSNRTAPGNMSIFQVYVPLVWDDIQAGTIHTITVSGPHGTATDASFPVGEMPADSYRKNATLKFIGDRNPWVPTPTPEIVKVVETQIIRETVIVTVTPPVEVMYTQQKKAIQETNTSTIIIGLLAVGSVIIAIVMFLYARSVYRRAKQ